MRGLPAALILGALALAVGVGCARTVAPTGGDVPEAPPRIVSLNPDTFQVLEPFDGPVRIEFERRLSERPTTGTLRDAVLVSPRTGEVQVRHRQRGRGLEIRMEGGFQDRTVYRITLLPTLQDLFRNTLDRPHDLFFSTGPEFEPNLVAGLLTDRLTLEPVPRARVDARPLPEGPVHSAVSDSLGVFSFRFLPAGRYQVVAYEDRNRNREPDFEEPQDSIEVRFATGDTVVVTELVLLQPDTTAAVLTRVRMQDSVTVEAAFDDHLDPERPLDEVRARLEREDGPGIQVVEILHRWEWEEREAERAAMAPDPDPDPDDPDPDPDAPPPDPELPPDPEAELPEPEVEEDPGPPLPSQVIFLILGESVEPATTYRVVVEGVRNLHGIPGGGGEVALPIPERPPEPEEEEPEDEEEPEEAPPPPPPDTAGIASAAVRPPPP